MVLRKLKGPAELLTPLLDGLDADDIMSLPPPDAGYRVDYDDVFAEEEEVKVEDAATAALREELYGLSLKGLRKVRALGVFL